MLANWFFECSDWVTHTFWGHWLTNKNVYNFKDSTNSTIRLFSLNIQNNHCSFHWEPGICDNFWWRTMVDCWQTHSTAVFFYVIQVEISPLNNVLATHRLIAFIITLSDSIIYVETRTVIIDVFIQCQQMFFCL